MVRGPQNLDNVSDSGMGNRKIRYSIDYKVANDVKII